MKPEYSRTTSCFSDKENSVLDALQSGDHSFLSDLLNEGIIDLEIHYPTEKHKNLLTLAVEKGDLEATKLIIASGAKVNSVNPLLKNVPLHIAVRKADTRMIETLLLNGADPNAKTMEGKTPLHIICKRLLENKGSAEDDKSILCLKLLLGNQKIVPDAKDGLGQSPIAFLVDGVSSTNPTKGVEHGVECLLNYGTDPFVQLKGKSSKASEVIANWNLPNLNRLIQKTHNTFKPLESKKNGIVEDLFNHLNEADLRRSDPGIFPKFKLALSYISKENLTSVLPPGQISLIQRASELGLYKFVELLIHKGASPDASAPGTIPAVVLASQQGHGSILRLLAEKANCNFAAVYNCETVLHSILKKPMFGALSRDVDYVKTWNELVSLRSEHPYIDHQLRSIINVADELGNTALHYSTQFWPQSSVSFLLELGANIGIKNSIGEVPVDRILPETLEKFLDNCCLEHEGNIANEDFKITVKYDFLAPPRGIELKDNSDHLPLPETEVLWHMSQNPNHRKLLKHPVITSFLWLKWSRISSSYNKNLFFYGLFVCTLTCYIFAHFGGRSLRSNGIVKEDCGNGTAGPFKNGVPSDVRVLWYVNIILVSLLTLREILQFSIAPRRYLFSPENWLELSVITLTFTLLLAGNFGCNVALKRQAGAIVIVLSWSELITMVGRHPKLSTYNIYVTMFYKVLWTFVVFLMWYSMFIFAFGLGFYILLHADDGLSQEDPDRYAFFDSLGLCLVKTFTMFVGELEFSDLPISSPVGYLFLLSFVFLIVVVMMNLLNGLAVSDTGVIREEAEIHSIVCQVEVISYIESMLLGDPFNFLSNWPTFIWLRNIPDCNLGSRIYAVPGLRSVFHKLSGGSGILLFYDRLPDKKVIIHPNRSEFTCCSRTGEEFHPSILSSAKFVISDKLKEDGGHLSSKIEALEQTIRILHLSHSEVLSKLDTLISKSK